MKHLLELSRFCSARPVLWASRVVLMVKNSTCQCRWHKRLGFNLWIENPLEEGTTTPSSILAWTVPWTEEPGGLQSRGSQRVGCDWSDLACMHDLYSIHSLTLITINSSLREGRPGRGTRRLCSTFTVEITMLPSCGIGCIFYKEHALGLGRLKPHPVFLLQTVECFL